MVHCGIHPPMTKIPTMKKICLLFVVLMHGVCHAQWQQLLAVEDGTWYIDPSTLISQKQPRIWTLFDHKTPVGAFGVRSVKTLVEADCQGAWLREISLVVFNQQMAEGSILRNTSPGTMKIFPTSGSAYEHLFLKLCPK